MTEYLDVTTLRKATQEGFTVECSLIYNVRELTGWISGQDLSKLFIKLTGDPSPKGYQEILWKDLPKKLKNIILDRRVAIKEMKLNGVDEECLQLYEKWFSIGANPWLRFKEVLNKYKNS